MKYLIKCLIGIVIGQFGGGIMDFIFLHAPLYYKISCGVTWGIISFCLGMIIGNQLFKPGVTE